MKLLRGHNDIGIRMQKLHRTEREAVSRKNMGLIHLWYKQ